MSWRRKIKTEMEDDDKKVDLKGLITHIIRGPNVNQRVIITTGNVVNLPILSNRHEPALLRQQHRGLPDNTRQQWSVDLLTKYIGSLQTKGFLLGVRVRTAYGRHGVIKGFRDPNEAPTFSGMNAPNCIYILFEDAPVVNQNPYLLFNEDELTILSGEQNGC